MVIALARPLNVPSVQNQARAQASSLEERLKELQTGQERSAAQVLQLQAALKDSKEGERRARGNQGTEAPDPRVYGVKDTSTEEQTPS